MQPLGEGPAGLGGQCTRVTDWPDASRASNTTWLQGHEVVGPVLAGRGPWVGALEVCCHHAIVGGPWQQARDTFLGAPLLPDRYPCC